jgi:hypothetical protein
VKGSATHNPDVQRTLLVLLLLSAPFGAQAAPGALTVDMVSEV